MTILDIRRLFGDTLLLPVLALSRRRDCHGIQAAANENSKEKKSLKSDDMNRRSSTHLLCWLTGDVLAKSGV